VSKLGIAFLCLLTLCSVANCTVKPGQVAHYLVTRAGEYQFSPVTDVWIVAEQPSRVSGKPYRWWQLIMKKFDGKVLALRVLSESVPMTSATDVGDIARYIYSPEPSIALEYVDQSTGRALLPEHDIRRDFLPRPAADARHIGGFASTGTFLGQVITKSAYPGRCPSVDFRQPKLLKIRTAFTIGTSRIVRDDGTPPGADYRYVPWTQEDVQTMIQAGFNVFLFGDQIRAWVENEPVFFHASPVFPDDFYRSNFRTGRMYLDEPFGRIGWNYELKERPTSPEMVAQALRQRIEYLESRSMRRFDFTGQASTGTLDLVMPKAPSWEYDYWCAWYELQAGAPGFVHEGMYGPGLWGYIPSDLIGEGFDLRPIDQFNFVYAFLRGAARSFDGYWGTSIYGQTARDWMYPAFERAYQMGAKCFWFWTTGRQHHTPYNIQLELARRITEYAEKHPRDEKALLRQAEVGIVIPSGYAINWQGVWGMNREAMNSHGATYGDIAAAAIWEAMLCSRKGIEYDFLVDHPGIEKLGYKRLVRVREDGSVSVTPPWKEVRAPKNLIIVVEKLPDRDSLVGDDIPTDYHVQQARDVKIDGNLTDWSDVEWVTIDSSSWQSDDVELTTAIRLPTDLSESTGDNELLGMTIETANDELKKKYHLDDAWGNILCIVTNVKPGSDAELAGIKEGDGLVSIAGRHEGSVSSIRRRLKEGPFLGSVVEVVLRRSRFQEYKGATDLSGSFALKVDDENLYLAAKVRDDTHVQNLDGLQMHNNDCLQLALDPVLDRRDSGYGENNHEFAFALRGTDTIVWRYYGRRGQPLTRSNRVKAKVVRAEDMTIYEAAIPLSELSPMCPFIWSKFGANVVISDNDGTTDKRKGRLELVPGASSKNPHPCQFAVFECPNLGDAPRISGALFWERRCMPVGGAAELTAVLCSPTEQQATVRAELISLDSPTAKPATATTSMSVTAKPARYSIHLPSNSAPGRYKLRVSILDEGSRVLTEEKLSVFVYPQ